MQVLAMALPHLSAATRERTIAYLDRRFAKGVPLKSPAANMKGRRREYYDLAPETLDRVAGQQYKSEADDLYALWAYAHYADRWPQVLAEIEAIRTLFDADVTAKPVQLDASTGTTTAVETVNKQIAATLAYGRIVRHSGDEAEFQRAARRLGAMVTERVHCERADQRLQTGRGHYKKLARYAALVPETGHILALHAGDNLRENLNDIDRELPVWYQAFGERLVGGENYISPPCLGRDVFLAMAYSGHRPDQQMTRYLDQPLCRADLAYIAKLTAVLTPQ